MFLKMFPNFMLINMMRLAYTKINNARDNYISVGRGPIV